MHSQAPAVPEHAGSKLTVCPFSCPQVLVHTPLTVRAAELQQLYCGLTLPSLSLDERLDVLLHVKWVAKEWDSSATRELVELIDREADLLNRCVYDAGLTVSQACWWTTGPQALSPSEWNTG